MEVKDCYSAFGSYVTGDFEKREISKLFLFCLFCSKIFYRVGRGLGKLSELVLSSEQRCMLSLWSFKKRITDKIPVWLIQDRDTDNEVSFKLMQTY